MGITTDEKRKILDSTGEVTPEAGRWAVIFGKYGHVIGYGQIMEVGEISAIIKAPYQLQSFCWDIACLKTFMTKEEAEKRFQKERQKTGEGG